MKKLIYLLGLVVLLVSACADNKTFYLKNGKEITAQEFDKSSVDSNDSAQYDVIEAVSYGWANYQTKRDTRVIYEPVCGNIVWSIILSETIVAPIYFTGWSIMEPVALVK